MKKPLTKAGRRGGKRVTSRSGGVTRGRGWAGTNETSSVLLCTTGRCWMGQRPRRRPRMRSVGVINSRNIAIQKQWLFVRQLAAAEPQQGTSLDPMQRHMTGDTLPTRRSLGVGRLIL